MERVKVELYELLYDATVQMETLSDHESIEYKTAEDLFKALWKIVNRRKLVQEYARYMAVNNSRTLEE